MRVNSVNSVQSPSFGMCLHMDEKSIRALGPRTVQYVEQVRPILEGMSDSVNMAVKGQKGPTENLNTLKILVSPLRNARNLAERLTSVIKPAAVEERKLYTQSKYFSPDQIAEQAQDASSSILGRLHG